MCWPPRVQNRFCQVFLQLVIHAIVSLPIVSPLQRGSNNKRAPQLSGTSIRKMEFQSTFLTPMTTAMQSQKMQKIADPLSKDKLDFSYFFAYLAGMQPILFSLCFLARKMKRPYLLDILDIFCTTLLKQRCNLLTCDIEVFIMCILVISISSKFTDAFNEIFFT